MCQLFFKKSSRLLFSLRETLEVISQALRLQGKAYFNANPLLGGSWKLICKQREQAGSKSLKASISKTAFAWKLQPQEFLQSTELRAHFCKQLLTGGENCLEHACTAVFIGTREPREECLWSEGHTLVLPHTLSLAVSIIFGEEPCLD